MEQPSVLIAGAGALGVVTGYHLALSGADVTFLVRPGRVAEIQPPMSLYCYDDDEVKEFSGYSVVGSVAEAAGRDYDFVLVTFDGATCRGEEATALLRELGEAIRASGALVIPCGIGVRAYIRDLMGLADERVVEGTMAMMSYQTDRVTMPLHPPTDPDKLARAAMAYRHVGGEYGFMLAGRAAGPVKEFIELYNRSGVSRCRTVPPTLYTMFTRTAFPTFAVFDMAGWPDAETMADNDELMSLCARAIKEIMRLPEHGLIGKLAGLLVSSGRLAKTNIKTEQHCLPADYPAFNKFHHGGKVRQQDIDVMKESLESGRKQGRAMPALEELLNRYEAHIASLG